MKYRNKKAVVDGITFASKAEARRYGELVLLQLTGQIAGLITLQPVFELAPGVKLDGEKRKRPPLRYVADFEYCDQYDRRVIEDVKGQDTPLSRAKRHLMKTTLGLDVRIVK